MHVFLVGISHKTTPVEIRERLSIPEEGIGNSLRGIIGAGNCITECVIISTCNRVEVYGVASGLEQAQAVEYVENMLHDMISLDRQKRHNGYFYHKSGQDAIKHLFEVACGLDSMVVGESEILSQVKSAYKLAHTSGATGKLTNVLFQRAMYIGKFVRTHTAINQGQTSVASMAVSLAERIFGELKNSIVLVIGAGKMAELTTKHLISQKVKELILTNRTHEKARVMADNFGGRAETFEKIPELLTIADIAICSTSSPDWIITKDITAKAMKIRRNRQLFVIDISVPRNVEPETHKLDNVFLYNIDDIEGLVKENLARRMEEIKKAAVIIDTRTREFVQWLESIHSGKEQSLKHTAPHTI